MILLHEVELDILVWVLRGAEVSNEAITRGEVGAEKVVKQISLSWSGGAQNPWHQVMRVVSGEGTGGGS